MKTGRDLVLILAIPVLSLLAAMALPIIRLIRDAVE